MLLQASYKHLRQQIQNVMVTYHIAKKESHMFQMTYFVGLVLLPMNLHL